MSEKELIKFVDINLIDTQFDETIMKNIERMVKRMKVVTEKVKLERNCSLDSYYSKKKREELLKEKGKR